jgi:hypothetical protein
MRKIDLAWAAGIVDGEGSISARFLGSGVQPRLKIGMTHKPTIERLREIFPNIGLYREFNRTIKGWKRVFEWSIYCQQVTDVLIPLLPYLVTKQKQAQILIKLSLTSKNKQGRYQGIEGKRIQAKLLMELYKLNQRKGIKYGAPYYKAARLAKSR